MRLEELRLLELDRGNKDSGPPVSTKEVHGRDVTELQREKEVMD